MLKKIYTLTVLLALFTVATTFGQSTAGPIQITSVADSTNVVAGNNFPYVFQRGETINIQGAYGLTAPSGGVAKAVWATYDVYAPDWSGVLYTNTQPIANDTVGTIDGNINFDYILANDAAYFGEHHDSTDPGDIKNAFYILQVRVLYDPVEDTFWNLFIEVDESSVGTRTIRPMLNNLNVYPNPATEQLFVTTDDDTKAKNVQIFDISGKLVLEQTLDTNHLDISSLQNGFHIIRVEQDGKVGGQKIMIQK